MTLSARTLVGLALLATALAGCKGSTPVPDPPVPLQDYADSGVPFDANEIVPAPAFTDYKALNATEVQAFLEQAPYSGASFLATYQSNGVLFSSTVTEVAASYRINPIVLLVGVEAVGGLVAAGRYPTATATVDYAFGCGCEVPADAAVCSAATAGLNAQLACFADALRTSLDEIAANAQTAGGWGPGVSATTLDGVAVTPADSSTAALYQYDPVAGNGRAGNSLFWSIWREYTRDLSYTAPSGDTGAVSGVGDPCFASSDCAVANAICASGDGYPGGMCTSKCAGSCPGPDSFCADFTAGGFCLAMCNPTVPASCRNGYACTLVKPSGAPAGTASQYVCTPS